MRNLFSVCRLAFLMCFAFPCRAADLVLFVPGEQLLRDVIGTTVTQRAVTELGVEFKVERNQQWVGDVTIGVFGSREDARRAYESCLRHISSIPVDRITSSTGELGIAWDRSSLFVRDNVFVTVTFQNKPKKHNYSAQKVATKIDDALKKGSHGVRRGNHVHIPIIIDYRPGPRQSWTAITDLATPGYTSSVNEQTGGQLFFATEGCVMAHPIRVTAKDLRNKRDEAKSRKH